jgi:hypothetical protein
LSILLIFLDEEDSNTEARQLNNEKNEEENAADSISESAARRR